MHVVLIAPYQLNRTGGVERYILSFARALSEHADVTLYTDTLLDEESISVHPLDAILKDQNTYDLCLTHAIYGSSPLPKAEIFLHTFHGTILGNLLMRPWLWIHPRFWNWLLLERRSLEGKDGIIGVSSWACREIRWMGYRGPLRLISSGGGLEKERVSSYYSKKQLKLIFCGRTSDKVKRFSWILKGFRLAREKVQNIELLVLGPRGCFPEEEGVRYLGDVSAYKVAEELSHAHVQINSSYYEGSSLALAEGIFQGGLITLATRRGGNLEMIEEGKTGFFFESPVELAIYIVRLAKDRALRTKMLENVNGKGWKWSWEKVVDEVLDFSSKIRTGEE
jgi:glycosyltransferase involved in cell wall biosynthesis